MFEDTATPDPVAVGPKNIGCAALVVAFDTSILLAVVANPVTFPNSGPANEVDAVIALPDMFETVKTSVAELYDKEESDDNASPAPEVADDIVR